MRSRLFCRPDGKKRMGRPWRTGGRQLRACSCTKADEGITLAQVLNPTGVDTRLLPGVAAA